MKRWLVHSNFVALNTLFGACEHTHSKPRQEKQLDYMLIDKRCTRCCSDAEAKLSIGLGEAERVT